MDLRVCKLFVSSPWRPLVYTPQDLVNLFKINLIRANRIIKDCNAGDPSGRIFDKWCNHHTLAIYMKDLVTSSEEPESENALSPHARWLMSIGWKLDYQRTNFRWIDPEDPDSHFTLSSATSIACSRMKQDLEEREDPNIIDADFEVRK